MELETSRNTRTSLLKDQPKTIRAWAMFDWANSAYNLVITSTVFPAYYIIITSSADRGDRVSFFGYEFINSALANYAMGVAYLIMVLLMPILSGLADAKGNKKLMMKLFTYLGSFACMGLFFFTLETLEYGIVLSSLAAMGYIGGVLFNNSYLPEIASLEQQDKVSAKGFAYGYVGSVILQVICFLFILMPEFFGIQDPSLPARLSFLLVGLWWLGFSQIPFRRLPEADRKEKRPAWVLIKKSFSTLVSVKNTVWKELALKRYLVAFFFSAMGVQTIMLVAAAYGEKVFLLGAPKLIATILLIQLIAIAGAYFISRMAVRIGNIQVLILLVGIWTFICVAAFYLVNEWHFYAMALLVGFVMGGIQSLSRSTFSKLIPEGTHDPVSFFSFYDVTEKLAIVCGLFTFAFVEELTNNIRVSALCLAIYFILAFILFLRVPKLPSIKAAMTN